MTCMQVYLWECYFPFPKHFSLITCINTISWVESHKMPSVRRCFPWAHSERREFELRFELVGLIPPAFPGPCAQFNRRLTSLTETLNRNNASKPCYISFPLLVFFFWNANLFYTCESVGQAVLGAQLSWAMLCVALQLKVFLSQLRCKLITLIASLLICLSV